MLRGLRRPWKSQHLWIDAICLNQAGLTEKRERVPLMGEIYHEARKVKIWLGYDDKSELQTLGNLRSLGNWLSSQNAYKKTLRKGDISGSMTNFLRHPWFRRRWTVQEALLNYDTFLYYGGSKIGWSKLARILAQLHDAQVDVIVQALESATAGTAQSQTLLSLIWDFHGTDCSDPRDASRLCKDSLCAQNQEWVKENWFNVMLWHLY